MTARPGVPTWCPDWCVAEHERALEEGCTPDEARVHRSNDLVGFLKTISHPTPHRELRHGGGAWELLLQADPLWDGCPTAGYPLIELWLRAGYEAGRGRDVRRDLTTGEARTLARQLTALADAADLAGGNEGHLRGQPFG